jgi:hypothetical protein
VLVVVREHREKLGDVKIVEGEAMGRWLGVVSRAAVGAVRDADDEVDAGEVGDEVDVGDWNVVQNNGTHPHTLLYNGQNNPESQAIEATTHVDYRSH